MAIVRLLGTKEKKMQSVCINFTMSERITISQHPPEIQKPIKGVIEFRHGFHSPFIDTHSELQRQRNYTQFMLILFFNSKILPFIRIVKLHILRTRYTMRTERTQYAVHVLLFPIATVLFLAIAILRQLDFNSIFHHLQIQREQSAKKRIVSSDRYHQRKPEQHTMRRESYRHMCVCVFDARRERNNLKRIHWSTVSVLLCNDENDEKIFS